MEKGVDRSKLILIGGIVIGVIILIAAIFLLMPKNNNAIFPNIIPTIFKGKTFLDYTQDLTNLTFTAEYQMNSSGVNFNKLKIYQEKSDKVKIDGEISGVKGSFLRIKDKSFFCNTKCSEIERLAYFVSEDLLNQSMDKTSSRNGKDCFALENNTLCFTKEGAIDYASINNKEITLLNITYSVDKEVFEVK
ncbi:hypothetical protein HY837_05630 [archaeon]|nr:hypothetical protein [archaeon]